MAFRYFPYYDIDGEGVCKYPLYQLCSNPLNFSSNMYTLNLKSLGNIKKVPIEKLVEGMCASG